MLTCIACSKQVDAGEDTARGNQNNREVVKSLTSQIKDMVLKLSGVYRQCKPGGPSSSSSYRKGGSHHRPYMGGFDDASEAGASGEGGGSYHPYLAGKGGSSSSTPAWDFTRTSGPPVGGGYGSDKSKLNRYEAWIPGAGVPVVESLESGCRDPASLMREEDKEPKEWLAQVEPGVHITFLSLSQGGNDLKRIRFSREMFNKWQAQRWWGENYDRIMELYNVQKFNRQALNTPPRSEDAREPTHSDVGSTRESPLVPVLCRDGDPHGTSEKRDLDDGSRSRTLTASSSSGAVGRGMNSAPPDLDPIEQFFPQCHHNHHHHTDEGGDLVNGEAAAAEYASRRTTTSSRDEASVSASNPSDAEMTEWVEQDEPGVYITIRQLGDGSRELRRVRFSREQFGETHAKLWWEENRERIHSHYL